MASAHDRAVLQAIFNPISPFGDIPGLNQEDELTDDGKMKIHNWITYAKFVYLLIHLMLYCDR